MAKVAKRGLLGKPMYLSPKAFVIAFVTTASLVCAPVQAGDVPALAKLLEPAFLAMNYGSVCAQVAFWAVNQPRGMHGTAVQYGQIVKMEVTSTLRADEEAIVLRTAADGARDQALSEYRKNVRNVDPTGTKERLEKWCRAFVTTHIIQFIADHDNSHSQFQANVRKALSVNQ